MSSFQIIMLTIIMGGLILIAGIHITKISNLEQSITRLETKIHDMSVHGMVVEDE